MEREFADAFEALNVLQMFKEGKINIGEMKEMLKGNKIAEKAFRQ